MKQAVQTTLFALFICLIPAMALAQNGSATTANDLLENVHGPSAIDQHTKLDTIESQADDEDQIRELNRDTIEFEILDTCSQTSDGLTGNSDARPMGGGICSRLKPEFTCVAYDGNQGGLCPPICHAPGGGCGYCEQDFGGTCHCSY